VDATLAWFSDLGVELKLEETGKYFPVTDDAQTVLDALLGAAGRAGSTWRAARGSCAWTRPAAGAYRLGVQRSPTATRSRPRSRVSRGAWPLPATSRPSGRGARVVLATGGCRSPTGATDRIRVGGIRPAHPRAAGAGADAAQRFRSALRGGAG